MFLRYTTRKKNGKEHRYYSLVENRRVASGRVVQRYALYLGEINDSQQEAWRKTIEIFEEGQARPRTVALFPEERIGAVADEDIVRIRLSQLSLHRPRQWGGGWLTSKLWEQLGLDRFWVQRLPPSRKGTRWDWVLQVLVTYRLLEPGSEWRLYRHWFEHSALADLLGADLELAEIHKLYECHERLLEHKRDLFSHLTGRWKDLFNARLKKLRQMKLKRDALLKKLGAALHDYPVGARLVDTTVPPRQATLAFTLRKDKLRQARQREGRYPNFLPQ